MQRGFKGVWIPAHVWLHPKLTLTDKVLLTEIDSLDSKRGCFAGNKYFADFIGVSEPTIKRSLSRLRALNLITTEMRDEKRYLRSKLTPDQNDLPRDQNDLPRDQNDPHTNTSTNTGTIVSPSGETEGPSKSKPKIKIGDIDKWQKSLDLLKTRLNNFTMPKRPDTPELGGIDSPKKIEVTYLFKRIITYLESLSDGTFTDKIHYEGPVKLKPMGIPEVYDLLVHALDRFDMMKLPEYWPAKKTGLDKVSGSSFFVSDKPGSRWSWFMSCLEREPRELKRLRRAKVPERWMNKAARMVGRDSVELTWALKDLESWMRGILQKQGLEVQQNWNRFSTVDRMMDRYFEFIDGYGGGPAIGHFDSQKIHDQFIAWSRKTYDVDLLGETDNFKRQARENRKRERPDIVRFRFRDFLNLQMQTLQVGMDSREKAGLILERWGHNSLWYERDKQGEGEMVSESKEQIDIGDVEKMVNKWEAF